MPIIDWGLYELTWKRWLESGVVTKLGKTKVFLRYPKSMYSSIWDCLMSRSYEKVKLTLELLESTVTDSTVMPGVAEGTSNLPEEFSYRTKILLSSSWVKDLRVVPGRPSKYGAIK